MAAVLTSESLEKLQAELEGKSAQEVLTWALEQYHPNIALASSFGAEDMVLIDMLVKINPKARIFTLDTGRLNQETYDVMDRCREQYGLDSLKICFPDTERVEAMVRERGINLFYESVENRKLCCHVRKVEPLERALQGLSAWITGLRREQAVTRVGLPKIELDEAHGNIVKLNPLADWTTDQVWAYIHENHVPYNRLHDQGYPSIGCEPCTRAVESGEDIRAGRWWWELPEYKECGLHVKS